MKKLLFLSAALLTTSAFAQSASPQAAAFAAADKDEDQKLSEREYIKMVETAQKEGKGSGPKLSRNDLRKTFAKLDKDGDEFLTMAEFAPEKKGSAPKKKGSAPKG